MLPTFIIELTSVWSVVGLSAQYSVYLPALSMNYSFLHKGQIRDLERQIQGSPISGAHGIE